MNEQQILAAAAAIGDPRERAVWLESQCAGDLELLQRIRRHLALIVLQELNRTDYPDDLLATPLLGVSDARHSVPVAGTAQDSTDESPRLSDRYTLLERIAEGGMGEVWIAQQHEPVKRRVAVKFIRAGMDSRAVLARFEAERQALAVMDHPHIAKVLDGGTSMQQRPFVVMEYVPGIPLTEYCDRRRLSIRERLELFVLICDAVQHAHHKGIIHRDLKPSNLLVAEVDGRPIPKVIDFGLAKALQGTTALTDRTLHTAFGTVVGTPLYMAPEQLGSDQLDVDTRSDLYSLGVILYELLTGGTPIDRARLRAAAWEEVRRIVREEEPPVPSSRLSSSGSLPAVASQRQEQSTSLAARVRGELDWIVMKALEKDRTRRYDSVSGFADDLRRYLVGEAVVAAPPSRLYLLRKWGGRHRALVASLAAISAVLLSASWVFAWQARIAIASRNAAIEAKNGEIAQRRRADEQRTRATNAELEARTRADELQLIVEFQARMLEQIDPVGAGQSLTREVQRRHEAALLQSNLPEPLANERRALLRDEWSRVNAADLVRHLLDENLLAPAVRTVDDQFAHRPLIDARLRASLGAQFFHLGLLEPALQLLAQTRDIRRRELGDSHPHTRKAGNNLAVALYVVGRYAEAESLFRETLKLEREVFGRESEQVLENLSTVMQEQGNFRQAEECLRTVLELVGSASPQNASPAALSAHLRLANLLAMQSQFSEAESLLKSISEAARPGLAEDDPFQIRIRQAWGVMLHRQGRHAEAEPLLAGVLAAKRRIYGDEHPTTLEELLNHGTVLQEQRKLLDAEKAFREACETIERLSLAAPLRARALHALGSVLIEQNRPAEALPQLQKAYEIRGWLLGADHLDTLLTRSTLGVVYWRLGQSGDAIPHLRAAWQGRNKLLGDHRDTWTTAGNLGVNLKDDGQLAESIAVLEQAYAASQRHSGLDWIAVQLADAHFRLEQHENAHEVLRQALANPQLNASVRGQWASMLVQHGRTLLRNDRSADSEPLLRQALTLREVDGISDWRRSKCQALLGAALLKLGRLEEAEPLLLTAYQQMQPPQDRVPPPERWLLPDTVDCLIELYQRLDDQAAVEQWRAERTKTPPSP